MVTWTDVLGAVSTTIAACAAIFAGLYAKKVFEATSGQLETAELQTKMVREELDLSQRQLDVAESTRKDQLLPILYPTGIYEAHSDQMIQWYDIKIKNSGPGTAYSIQAIISKRNGMQSYSAAASIPVLASQEDEIKLFHGGVFSIAKSAELTGHKNDNSHSYSFFPGETPTSEKEKQTSGFQDKATERLVLTYHDCYGRIHASIWEVDEEGNVQEIVILLHIPKDIKMITT